MKSKKIRAVKSRLGLIFLGLLIVGGALLVWWSNRGAQVSAAWFDDNWGYRKTITLTVASSASDITGLDTLVTIDTTGITDKLQTACQDLRFTNQGGDELPFYIDTCNDNSASNKVWIRADLVPKNTTTYTIYMYYGNPSAVSASNSTLFTLYNGLMSYWTMNESSWTNNCSTATVIDSSVNANNATSCPSSTGPTGGVSSKFANGGTFDGTNDYLDAGNGSGVNVGTSDFTLNLWIKRAVGEATSTDGDAPLGKGDWSSSKGWAFFVNRDGGLVEFQAYDSSNKSQYYSNYASTLNDNTWHMLTIVQDRDVGGIFYIDGVLRETNSTTFTGDINSATSLLLGHNRNGVDYYHGGLDEVRMYNRILSQSEITELVNNPGAIATNATATSKPTTSFSAEEKALTPVAYWKFDEGTGTAAKDSSSNRNNATLAGAALPTWQTVDQCISQKCLYFGGSTSYVNAGNSTSLNPSALTFSAWVKTNANSGDYEIISKQYGTSTNVSFTMKLNSGVLQFTVCNSGATCYAAVDPSGALPISRWYYVTGTYDGSTAKLYKNGVLIHEKVGSVTIGYDTNPIFIGARSIDSTTSTPDFAFFNGFIDEPKIFNYARSADQIKLDYNSRGGATAKGSGFFQDDPALSEGLVGYWKMDESSGNAADYSGNGATLTNNATATFTGGKFGNATSLTRASSQYYSRSSTTPLSISGDLTLSTWIKPSSNTAATQFDILGKWDDTNTSYLLVQYGTELRLYLNSTSNYVTSTNANLATGVFYHVGVTYVASTQKVNMYLNGSSLTTTVTGTIPASINTNSGSFYIGADNSLGTTSVDYQVAASADDGRVYQPQDLLWQNNTTTVETGYYFTGGYSKHSWFRFTGVSGLSGKTITAAYLSLHQSGSACTGAQSSIYANKVAAPTAPTTAADYTSKTLTTAFVNFDCPITANAWNDSPSLVPVIQELVNAVNPSAIMIMHKDRSSPSGQQFTTDAYDTSAALAAKLHIEYPATVASPQNFYNGLIDETRVYNRALSGPEFLKLANFGPSSVGYWNFEQGEGNTVNDLSGNGNDGSITAGSGDYTNGRFGKGYRFDKATTSINAGSGSTLDDMQAMTIEAWIKPVSTGEGGVGVIAAKNVGTTPNAGWIFQMGGSNNVSFKVDGSTDLSVISTTAMTLNNWYHVAITWDGVISSQTGVKIFVNGVESSYTGGQIGASRVSDASSSLFLGNDSTSANTFDGGIDEVKIYNYVRTRQQIIEDMNGGHPVGGSPIGSQIGYWKLEEGVGTSVGDSSIQGNTGTMGNFASPPSATSGWTNAGKFGKALNYDGVDDSLNVGSQSNLDQLPALTASAWINPRTVGEGSAGRIFDKTTGVNPDNGWTFALSSSPTNSLAFKVDNSPGADLVVNTAANTVTYNTWQYVAVTWDGSNTAKNVHIYVNGVEVAYDTQTNGAASRVDDSSSSLRIGNDSTNAKTFDGWMDELKLYSVVLEPSSIAIDYNRGQALVLGSLGTSLDGKTASNAASAAYCVPGSTSSCSGPLAEWKFEEKQGTTANDTSGNAYSGTLTSSPVWTTGKIGTALDFDGSASYVLVDKSGLNTLCDYNVNTGFTIQSWFFFDGSSGNQTLVGLGSSSSGTPFCMLSSTGAAIRFEYRSDNNTEINGGSAFITDETFVDGKWHHAAVVRSGSTFQIYVDGILRKSRTDTGFNTVTINRQTLGGNRRTGALENAFNGKLDQPTIYNYARSASQIAYDYNRGLPIAYYKMDECQGTQVYDSSGNGQNGTITGTIGTCTDNASTVRYNGRNGKYNASLSFNGSSDYVSIADSTTLRPTMVSLSAWFNLSGNPTQDTIISKAYTAAAWSSPYVSWLMRINSTTEVELDVGNGSNYSAKTFAVPTLLGSTWYHLAMTYDGTTLTGYLNGVKLGTSTTISGNIGYAAQPVIIGADYSASPLGGYFPGQIDEVKIFGYALTDYQVRTEFNQGAAVRFGPLTGNP